MSIFKSKSSPVDGKSIEKVYQKGLISVRAHDLYVAADLFKQAADRGHIPSIYQLALAHGSGAISPYNVDFAVDNCYRAAQLGYPKAVEQAQLLAKADDTTFGTTALALFGSRLDGTETTPSMFMLASCRLYSALCERYDAFDEVINCEPDAASSSDHAFVRDFVERTAIPSSMYRNGIKHLQDGSAADQITDGLNQLYMGLKQSGYPDRICIFARCTIVGYVVSKSKHGHNAGELLGFDKFFGRA